MKTGMLGDVTFEVSSDTYRTITGLKRSEKANYSTHKLVGKKGVIEFTGTEPEEISFEILFSAWFGENPEKWRRKLETILLNGESVFFVLGTRPIGNRWVIEELEFETTYYYKDGTPADYKASVKIKEDP